MTPFPTGRLKAVYEAITPQVSTPKSYESPGAWQAEQEGWRKREDAATRMSRMFTSVFWIAWSSEEHFCETLATAEACQWQRDSW